MRSGAERWRRGKGAKGQRGKVKATLRTLHSELRTPPPIPHSALCIPHLFNPQFPGVPTAQQALECADLLGCDPEHRPVGVSRCIGFGPNLNG